VAREAQLRGQSRNPDSALLNQNPKLRTPEPRCDVEFAAFGVLEISSVEPTQGLWRRQLIGLGIGLGLMFATTLYDYRRVVNAAPYLYGVGVALLALALPPLGRKMNGNKSWLYLRLLGGLLS